MQFFAILKDSFREAVDGFVIYVMLALAVLTAIVVASISFTPDPPEQASQAVTRNFFVIFPDKGKSAAPTVIPPDALDYSTTLAEQSSDGTVKFVLKVTQQSRGPQPRLFDDGKTKEPSDVFRYAVFAWTKPPGEKIQDLLNRNKGRSDSDERKLEILVPPKATEAELSAITDEEMISFLKSQFSLFVGIPESDVTISRRREGVEEPNYQFNVELKGATTARGWPQTLKVGFNAITLGDNYKLGRTVYRIEDGLVGWIGGTVTLVISIIITAFFIPNMLRKGSLDLLVSKPIGRVQLLISKYCGGLIFIFILTTVTVGLVWLGISLRAGYWDPTILIMIPSLTFTFAILYAISTAVAVFTRSAIASILITIAMMFFLFVVGWGKKILDANRVIQFADVPKWIYWVVDGLHAILPRYKDLDRLTEKLLVQTNLPLGEARLDGVGLIEDPSWGGAIGVSLLFIVVVLGLACWKFAKRDG